MIAVLFLTVYVVAAEGRPLSEVEPVAQLPAGERGNCSHARHSWARTGDGLNR